MNNTIDISKTAELVRKIRVHIINQVSGAASGHIGGSFSSTEIMTVLYFNIMNIKPAQPRWEKRDRFVLSKGHCSPVLYAVLAQRGFFDVSELKSFRKPGGFLQGHPDMNLTPGVDMTTGSLGQGISAAVGMALSAKAKGETHRVYALLGDGELQEGQVWEALMCAAHYKLDNLCVIIDNNGLQIDGTLSEVMSLGDIQKKMDSFGFDTQSIDGHDTVEIFNALSDERHNGKPMAVIAKTIKGKGVSFMENSLKWHGTAPDAAQAKAAICELTAI